LDLEIRVSPVTQVYARSYIKIQDIVARANGLTSIALIILLIFVSPYSNLKFYESLINDLFDVKTFKDKDPQDPQFDRKKTLYEKIQEKQGKTKKKSPSNKKKFYLNKHDHKTVLDAQNILCTESPGIRLTSEVLDSPKPFKLDDQDSSHRHQPLMKLKTITDSTTPRKK